MRRGKAASALGKPNSCTRLATKPGMPPGTPCSPTSKDITLVSGFVPPSGTSPPNRQSAKPLNPVSTKSREGHTYVLSFGRMAERFKAAVLKTAVDASPPWVRIPLLPPYLVREFSALIADLGRCLDV